MNFSKSEAAKLAEVMNSLSQKALPKLRQEIAAARQDFLAKGEAAASARRLSGVSSRYLSLAQASLESFYSLLCLLAMAAEYSENQEYSDFLNSLISRTSDKVKDLSEEKLKLSYFPDASGKYEFSKGQNFDQRG